MDRQPLFIHPHQMVLFPAITVSADLVASFHHLAGHLRVALKGQGAAEKGGFDPKFVEQVQQAPDTDSAAVLKERLVVQVTFTRRDRRRNFAVSFMMGVAVLNGLFGAFRVVNH